MAIENSDKNNVDSLFVPIHRVELIELIKARTERDLILAMAAEYGFDSFKVRDLVGALARLNSIPSKENAEDKTDA